MSIQDNIHELQNLILERKAGPITPKSCQNFDKLFTKAIETGGEFEGSNQIRRKIHHGTFDSNDITIVKKIFSNFQLDHIIKSQKIVSSISHSKSHIFSSAIEDLPSEEEKIEFTSKVLPLFNRLNSDQTKVFSLVISCIPYPLRVDQAQTLVKIVSTDMDTLTSLHCLLHCFPCLEKNIKSHLKNTNEKMLLQLEVFDILKNQTVTLNKKSAISQALAPFMSSLASHDEKVMFVQKLSPLFSKFHIRHFEVFSKTLLFLPDNLNINQIQELITSVGKEESPEDLKSIQHMMSKVPELQEEICDRLLANQNSSHFLLKLPIDSIPKNHPLLERIGTIHKENMTLKVLSHFFPYEIREMLFKKLKEKGKYTSITEEKDITDTRISLNYLKEVLTDYPEVIQNSLYSHWLEACNDADLLFQMIISNADKEEDELICQAKNILKILDFFPKTTHDIVCDSILATLPESLEVQEQIKTIIDQNPELKDPLFKECEDRLCILDPSENDVEQVIHLSHLFLSMRPALEIEKTHSLMQLSYHLNSTLNMLPKDLRRQALDLASHLIKLDFLPNQLFSFIYESNSERQEDIIKYINQALLSNDYTAITQAINLILDNKVELYELIETAISRRNEVNSLILSALESSDQEQALGMALYILENPILYGNFLPMALLVKDINTKTSLAKKNNPYTLYAKLKKVEKADPLFLTNISGSFPSGTFSLNQTQISSFIKLNIDFKSLPSISYEDFAKLIKQLSYRVTHLKNPSDLNKIKSYVKDITGDDLANLVDNFSYSLFLKNILEEKNSLNYVYFSAILQYIIDQDQTLDETHLLSEQEETLLKMSASIQECKTGKEYGIRVAYTHLPPAYQLSGIEKEGSSIEYEAKQFLKSTITAQIMSILSPESPFLKELVKENESVELLHEILYIKNLIGKDIGLNHEVTFDRHSEAISPSLIKMSRPEVLTIFYNHFTPKTLVSNLVNVFNNLTSEEKQAIYQGFTSLGLETADEVWDVEEGLKLKEEGAIRILVKLGLLNR